MGKSKNPQVFINFRGKDERRKLLPHLKHHLKDSNVNVFTDDDAIGEPVENLFKHIRRSRIVIVIFSINYLESEWCLDELVEIKKCLETEKIDFAIPIFYKVKTSHVKKQRGKFGKKFVALQKKHRNSRVRRWKKALRFVAKSVGMTYEKRSSISELDFIKMIVERVDFTLTKIASKDNNNNYHNDGPETSKGESSNLTDVNHLNKMINSSTTLDVLNLERFYLQGFMAGSAWKDDVISSMHRTNTSSISHPESARGHNRGGFQNSIYGSVHSGSVHSRRRLSSFVKSLVESYRLLEPKLPQDYRRTISYYSNINEYHHGSYEIAGFDLHMEDDVYPLCAVSNIDPESEDQNPILSTSHDAEEREDKTSCIFIVGLLFQTLFLSYMGRKRR